MRNFGRCIQHEMRAVVFMRFANDMTPPMRYRNQIPPVIGNYDIYEGVA